MNNTNRDELRKAIALIEQAKDIIDNIKSDEEQKFENLSEGLQQSEKGQKFEEVVSHLDDSLSGLDDAIENVELAIE